jgi:hypothetical protein
VVRRPATFTKYYELRHANIGKRSIAPISPFGHTIARFSGFGFSSYHHLTLSIAAMTAISKEIKRKRLFQDSYTFNYVPSVTHTRDKSSQHAVFSAYVIVLRLLSITWYQSYVTRRNPKGLHRQTQRGQIIDCEINSLWIVFLCI